MGESVNESLRSRFQQLLVNRTTTGTTDTSFSVEPYFNHGIQTVIAGTATVNYRGSIDGTNSVLLATVTSTTINQVSGKYKYIFANVSAVSGTVNSYILSGL